MKIKFQVVSLVVGILNIFLSLYPLYVLYSSRGIGYYPLASFTIGAFSAVYWFAVLFLTGTIFLIFSKKENKFFSNSILVNMIGISFVVFTFFSNNSITTDGSGAGGWGVGFLSVFCLLIYLISTILLLAGIFLYSKNRKLRAN